MKKRLLTLTVLFAMTIKIFAQIPNYNFENWGNGANAAPTGWEDHGSNQPGFYPASQTTDKYLGTFAVRLENKLTASDTAKGIINTIRPNGGEGFGPAFPVAARYNSLKGFYKYDPLNNDSAQIIVFITKTGYVNPQPGYGDLLAWGQSHLPAASTYTPFSVGYSSGGFIYFDNVIVPDSAYIAMAAYKFITALGANGKPLGNSILNIDALNFDTFLTGINEASDITSNFNLFPNANSGIFDVIFETSENEYTTIKIFDIEGREIVNLFEGNLSAGNHAFHYSMPELSPGNYLYVVASAKGYRAEKICIQK